jgi:hypothetical protein
MPKTFSISFVLVAMTITGCGDSERQKREEALLEERDRQYSAYHESLRKESDAYVALKQKEMKADLDHLQSAFEGDPYANLVEAVRRKDAESVTQWLSAGAYQDQQTPDDGRALVLASGMDQPEIVKLLLKAGANPNKPVKKDVTPLLAAAQTGGIETVQALLSNGADMELASNYGVTPLFAAVFSKHEELAMFLLERGADVEAKNIAGATVLDMARMQKLDRVVAAIEQQRKTAERANSRKRGTVAAKRKKPQRIEFPEPALELDQPDGFEQAINFTGFQKPEDQASILMARLPGSFEACTEQFDPKRFAASGMNLKSQRKITHDSKRAVLINVEQEVEGSKIEKWILAFGDDNETRLLTASFRAIDHERYSEDLKDILLSSKSIAAVRKESQSKVLTRNSFEIMISGDLTPVSSLSVGDAVCLTRTGTIPLRSPGEPMFVAGPSISPVKAVHREEYSRQRLNETAETRIERVMSHKAISIDGLNGFETHAVGKYTSSGTPLRIYQVMLFEDDGYFLMQGLVGRDDTHDTISDFETMARSFSRRE